MESLPFTDGVFDVVTALHVVNHADLVPRAIEELRRVLKPEGQCLISTPSRSHLRELRALLLEYDRSLVFPTRRMLSFLSEDAPVLLRQSFRSVEVRPFNDHLVINNPDAIVRYYLSIFDGNGYPDLRGHADSLRKHVKKAIKERGPLQTEALADLFICCSLE